MITDDKARIAINTLIDYCNGIKSCRDCVIGKPCHELKKPFKGFWELEHMPIDGLSNIIKAENLAIAMASQIMNRKD